MAKVTIGQTLQHLFCKMLQKGACDITSKEVSFEWGPQTAGFLFTDSKVRPPYVAPSLTLGVKGLVLQLQGSLQQMKAA